MCGVHMSRYQHGRVISRPPRGVGVRGSTRPPDGGIRVRGPVSSAGERHSPTGPGASSYCVCACGLQGLVAFPHPPLNIKNRAWVQHGGPFPGPSGVYALPPSPPDPYGAGGGKGIRQPTGPGSSGSCPGRRGSCVKTSFRARLQPTCPLVGRESGGHPVCQVGIGGRAFSSPRQGILSFRSGKGSLQPGHIYVAYRGWLPSPTLH